MAILMSDTFLPATPVNAAPELHDAWLKIDIFPNAKRNLNAPQRMHDNGREFGIKKKEIATLAWK